MNAQRTKSESKVGDRKPQNRKDDAWDDRLRRVGDARYTEVTWSGRDDPVWPLPRE